MNDFLRLIDRVFLRPRGYRIARAPTHRLPPIRNLEKLAASDGRPADTVDPALRSLTVCLRTCLREPRRSRRHDLVDAALDEVILTCLASLVTSINQASASAQLDDLQVLVTDDRSEPEARARIEAALGELQVPWRLETPAETRAGPIMHAQFKAAAGQERLFYFVEDDYLHRPEAVEAMVAFYRQVHAATETHLMLHPQEQRSLYVRHYPGYLFTDGTRHWRTTSDMSHTLFTHGAVLRDHWRFFENTKYVGHRRRRMRHKGSERRTTNRLLAILPGFSPIPSLAAHFQAEALIPPFFDWRPLYEANRPR